MRTLAILKNLALILLLAFAASGTVNAKLASGPQTLGPDLHQAQSLLEPAPRLGWSESSYDEASGSPVVTRGGDAFTGIKEASQVLQSAGFPRSARVQILQSFEAGTVSVGQAGANQFGLRFFGGKAKASGGFLFETFPASRQSLALRPEFNAMTGLRQFQIRPGATVISGRAASQGVGFEGGQLQRFILDPSRDLFP